MTPNQREDMDREIEAMQRFERLNIRRGKLSMWEKYNGEVGMFLWMFAALLAGTAFWLSVNGIERWFR